MKIFLILVFSLLPMGQGHCEQKTSIFNVFKEKPGLTEKHEEFIQKFVINTEDSGDQHEISAIFDRHNNDLIDCFKSRNDRAKIYYTINLKVDCKNKEIVDVRFDNFNEQIKFVQCFKKILTKNGGLKKNLSKSTVDIKIYPKEQSEIVD